MAGFAPFKQSVPGNEIRMVLIGKTGTGKSKTGNSIIGDKRNQFPFGCNANSITFLCSWKTTVRFGKKLDVVDTPGVFDTHRANFEVQKEIARCIALTTPGPHALLYCAKMGRFTQEDIDTVEHFVKYFGEELLNYTIVVFTQVDQWELDEEEKGEGPNTVEQYIQDLPDNLRRFIDRIENRYVFVNNRLQGRQQEDMVRKLIKNVETLILTRNNKCYTNANYEKTEKILKEEAEKNQLSRDEVKNSPSFFLIIYKMIEFVVHIIRLFF